MPKLILMPKCARSEAPTESSRPLAPLRAANEDDRSVARKPISTGEETTFDYAMRNYSVEYFPDHCRCGSRHCRDHITGWRDLPARRKADYHGFVAPYLISIDKKAAAGVA